MIAYGTGGFAVGFLEKQFPNLPTLPVIGKKGAIALAAYMLHGKHPFVRDVGLAASAIAGYELGSTGRVTGDVLGEEDDEVLSGHM